MPRRLGRLLTHQPAGELGLQRDHRQAVAEQVVQIARESRALLGDRKPRELGACRVQLALRARKSATTSISIPMPSVGVANTQIAPPTPSAANSEPTQRAVHSSTP